MAAKIYPFFSPEDQQVIQTAIQVFLSGQTGRARDTMLKTIRAVLDRYRISKFSFPDYVVEATRVPGYAVIRAKKLITGYRCPFCAEPLYGLASRIRILSVQERRDYHLVTYGCRCGKIFAKPEEC